MGTDEATMRMRAGAAAWAKKAAEAADQVDVARVVNPIGLRMRVAGSSFIVMRKTNAAPASIPGRIRGSVIVEKT